MYPYRRVRTHNSLLTMKNILTNGLAALVMGGSATAASTFTENFDTNDANWRDTATGAVDYVTTGGPGGAGDAYISVTQNFELLADDDTVVLFRAQDEFGSSGGAFEGNYLTSNTGLFSVQVRHDAAIPLNFFARFSSPFNFPGATAVAFVPAR